jgi:hypothetical protein
MIKLWKCPRSNRGSLNRRTRGVNDEAYHAALTAFPNLDDKQRRGKRTPQLRRGNSEPEKNFVFEVERKACPRARHSSALSLDTQVATVERRHGDKRAKLRKRRCRKRQSRSFNVGDIVHLYNPARKPGKFFKFHKFWTGSLQVTAKLSELNYEIA